MMSRYQGNKIWYCAFVTIFLFLSKIELVASYFLALLQIYFLVSK